MQYFFYQSKFRAAGFQFPRRQKCATSRSIIILTPQYHKATLKENHYVIPLIHNSSLAKTSSLVNDQWHLKTIVESHVSSAVAYADMGGLNSPKYDSEIEARPSVLELGK
jgi:hypothetical protein